MHEHPSAENPAARERRAEQPPVSSTSPLMVMLLHLFTFVCCANWIFGVLGIVFAVRASARRDRGLHREAEVLTRYSWYCLGAGAVMFVVMVILTAVLVAMGLPFLQRQTPVPY